jgi:hypothetical protein
MLKKPTERFDDLRAMMAELERVDAELRGVATSLAGARAVEPATELVGEVARARGRTVAAIVGVAALVGVVAAGVAVAVRRPPAIAASPAPPVAAPVAAAAPSTAPMQIQDPYKPAPESEVEIVIRTVPAGAEVRMGGARVGMSPIKTNRTRGDAPIAVSFHRAGYRDSSREVIPNKDQDIEVVLAPQAQDKGGHEKVHDKKPPRVAANPKPASPERKPPPKRVQDLRNPFE